RARPAVQHGPGDGHGRHRRAEQGRDVPGVEPAEVRLGQHASPLPQPVRPHGDRSWHCCSGRTILSTKKNLVIMAKFWREAGSETAAYSARLRQARKIFWLTKIFLV